MEDVVMSSTSPSLVRNSQRMLSTWTNGSSCVMTNCNTTDSVSTPMIGESVTAVTLAGTMVEHQRMKNLIKSRKLS